MTSYELYVNIPEKKDSPDWYPTLSKALLASRAGQPASDDASACSDSGKAYPAPPCSLPHITILLGPGTYREKLVITRPNLTIQGAGAEETILVYGDAAYDAMPEGEKRGTFRTATLRIDAPDITLKDLTVQNDAGYGHTVGQAIALYADADRLAFYDCRFLASQDTIFDAPLPEKEAKPGGFKGPGEYKPRILGRHYYERCYLQGDVDFLFGSGIAWYEECTIFSKKPGDRIPPEAGDKPIYGYVTAASTPQSEPYGQVFHRCRLVSDCPPHSVYLGRPWREWAKTVFLDCELGEHIHPDGWLDWGKEHGHFFYAEYHSTGPGASADTRADFSRQLTDAEAAEYTKDNVLNGWCV